MANFGVRFATPAPARRPVMPAVTVTGATDGRPRSMSARALALAGRVMRGLLRAIDDAPFDLAWPPSPRASAARAAWRAELAAAREQPARDDRGARVDATHTPAARAATLPPRST